MAVPDQVKDVVVTGSTVPSVGLAARSWAAQEQAARIVRQRSNLSFIWLVFFMGVELVCRVDYGMYSRADGKWPQADKKIILRRILVASERRRFLLFLACPVDFRIRTASADRFVTETEEP